MKIAACVILYNPEEPVIENIHSYINHVGKLFLIDNSQVIRDNLQKKYNSLSNTIIIHDGNNEGIAKRLNQACELAISNNFDYLLTMDQDSNFNEDVILKYFQCLESIQEKDVSMVGVNYKEKTDEFNCNYSKTNLLITSGSIINLKLFRTIGGFDEKLFIDFVDTEYCFRSIQKNYSVIEFKNIFLQHNLGQVSEKYSLKSLKKTKRTFHSEMRLYYMIRNYFYLKFLYQTKFPKEIAYFRRDIFNRIKNKVLYENNRVKTIKLIVKGIFDYKKNKLGKQS